MYVILHHLYQKRASLSDSFEHVDRLDFVCHRNVVNKNPVGKTCSGVTTDIKATT